MEFSFNEKKNRLLIEKRGISFVQIIQAAAEAGILLDVKHPNNEKYPDQRMFVVEFSGETYCVPYVLSGDNCFLKTVYPNRKYRFLLNQKEEKNEY
jgi:uncharacterized DUF497 family protein